MKNSLGQIRLRLFGLSPQETSYIRRGFRGATEAMRNRLEHIGRVFLQGYHAAIEAGSPETVVPRLEVLESEERGFAFEGAAMGFALLDRIIPWKRTRISRFLNGAGDAHAYMVHVGVGWVLARLPFRFERAKQRLDPLLGWLTLDGWGFHEGFFHWPKYIQAQAPPSRLQGYAKRVFDQGLGRAFWFVNGGNPGLIASTIDGFPSERRADLWSGLGSAATYAGLAPTAALELLRESAGPCRKSLAQGAAFAAKARQRAGNSIAYTDLATRVLCGMSAVEASHLCDTTLENLPAQGPQPAYELWRQRLQSHFQKLQPQEVSV